ncbi:hypothetical protein FSW04_06350 [Baekduia soli]|uniref:Aromatic ring-opening dioxygenase LigA n=1 Tax=Baekduia soli TaxID=496014 RepID=A0A5B8U2I8_9ACTN|nr:hypothetical protein [Baekduia soli]QEC47247.1 hypothetical protein FSW04_06350 [Baekduia soli]
MRSFLTRITTLTPIAVGLALGMVAAGVLAVVGGSYACAVVRDQLAPQKITFPQNQAQGLFPDLKQYAGQTVDNGAKAKAYADKFINRHLQEVAGGQTYAQVSTKALAAPDDQKLAAQKATLFQGETLRGLLLSVWGWSVVATIATIGGILLIVLGAILAGLPLTALALGRERKLVAA